VFFLNLGFTQFCAVLLLLLFIDAPLYTTRTHTTCAPTRAGFQNYTLGDPYDTWCTCINTETKTDHRLFHGNTDRRRPTLKKVTP